MKHIMEPSREIIQVSDELKKFLARKTDRISNNIRGKDDQSGNTGDTTEES
jgi:hypothetical protein